MRGEREAGRRPFTRWLLATTLLSIALACREPTTTMPPWASVTGPIPTPTEFIFVADASGTVLGQLTEGSWPSWSPDGRRLVFHRDSSVHVIDADGANDVALGKGLWPTWSPDGKQIAFLAPRGLSLMNADGSSVRTLMPPTMKALFDWGVGKPAWSPDGTRIAFDQPDAYADGFPARVIVMRADGSSSYALAGESQYETEPSWSPDGTRVAYWSTDYGLGIIGENGGKTTQLYKDQSVAFAVRPAWSPDGRTILFGTWPKTSIMTISADGGSARVLIDQGAEAAWSPDGTRIAFVRLVLR